MSQSQGRQAIADGRIVWTVGSLFKGRIKTDMNTRQPSIDPKTGEKIQEYGFGIAIPKTALSQPGPDGGPNIWQQLHAEAMTMFPGAQAVPPSFAMKFKDGDGLDDKGLPFSQREGYAGHIVLACTTRIPIKYFKWENGGNVMINEGIKCGDYVRVALNIKAHAAQGQGKAGLYVNPSAVQFLGFGTEIINTPDGNDIFGQMAPPTMGSATPLAPPGGMPGVPAMPGQPQFAPQAQPVAPAFQQQAPAPVQPHYGVVPQQHQPPPGGMPMGNVPQPVAYPAPGVAAIPTVGQTNQYGVSNVAQPPNGMPAIPGYPPQQ